MRVINTKDYYLFNEKYFINTFESLGSSAILFEAINSQKKVECVAIIIIYGIYAHYHLSGRIQGSDNSINNFILDEAVKYAIKKSTKYFHFGGGNTSHFDDSLLKFKASFSKDRGDFYIGKKIHNEKIYNYVINKWENRFQEKVNNNRSFLLRYRI